MTVAFLNRVCGWASDIDIKGASDDNLCYKIDGMYCRFPPTGRPGFFESADTITHWHNATYNDWRLACCGGGPAYFNHFAKSDNFVTPILTPHVLLYDRQPDSVAIKALPAGQEHAGSGAQRQFAGGIHAALFPRSGPAFSLCRVFGALPPGCGRRAQCHHGHAMAGIRQLPSGHELPRVYIAPPIQSRAGGQDTPSTTEAASGYAPITFPTHGAKGDSESNPLIIPGTGTSPWAKRRKSAAIATARSSSSARR